MFLLANKDVNLILCEEMKEKPCYILIIKDGKIF